MQDVGIHTGILKCSYSGIIKSKWLNTIILHTTYFWLFPKPVWKNIKVANVIINICITNIIHTLWYKNNDKHKAGAYIAFFLAFFCYPTKTCNYLAYLLVLSCWTFVSIKQSTGFVVSSFTTFSNLHGILPAKHGRSQVR